MPTLGVGQVDPKKIGVIAVLTLALLIAGNGAYSYWTVSRPVTALLGNHPALRSHEIVRQAGRPPVVKLTVKREADMVQVHEVLGEELKSKLGAHQMEIVDARSPQLTAFLAQAQYALYEGAANGSFVQMHQILAGIAADAGVQAEVVVRPGWIYLKATTPDAYLFEVIERTAPAAGGNSR